MFLKPRSGFSTPWWKRPCGIISLKFLRKSSNYSQFLPVPVARILPDIYPTEAPRPAEWDAYEREVALSYRYVGALPTIPLEIYRASYHYAVAHSLLA